MHLGPGDLLAPKLALFVQMSQLRLWEDNLLSLHCCSGIQSPLPLFRLISLWKPASYPSPGTMTRTPRSHETKIRPRAGFTNRLNIKTQSKCLVGNTTPNKLQRFNGPEGEGGPGRLLPVTSGAARCHSLEGSGRADRRA